MHNFLMLLAMPQNKYDIKIQKTLQYTYNLKRQFQRGELPIDKTRLQKTDLCRCGNCNIFEKLRQA